MSARFNVATRPNEGQKETTTQWQRQTFPGRRPSPFPRTTSPPASPPPSPPPQKKRQRHEEAKQAAGAESSSDLRRLAASPVDGPTPLELTPASPQPDSTPRPVYEFLFKLGARKSSVIFNSTETLQTCPTNCSLPVISSFQGPTAQMAGDTIMLFCKPDTRHRLISRSRKYWRKCASTGFVVEIHQTYGHYPQDDLETTYYIAMMKDDGRAFTFTLPLPQLPAIATSLTELYRDFTDTKKTQ